MNYDAIIVGSRIAGAATAMLLARRGYKVLVADRAAFPSNTISTHIIWQPGINHLIDVGLGKRIAALGAPPIRTMELDYGQFSLRGALPNIGRATATYAPRRKVLDTMLVDAARTAGAEVRERCPVEDLLLDDGRVAGIRIRGKDGSVCVERAKVVIGADGVHSTVARAVQAAEYNLRPTLACWYYSYWSGVRRELLLFSRPGRAFGCIPTNDGLACIAVAWPHHRFAEVKADVEAHYMSSLDIAPAFKEEVLSGKREERFYGTGHVPNYFRKPYGPGWALVGDSAYHKDPILGQGITDALRDASLLAGALDDVFACRATWESALSGYESARNAAVRDIYEMNCQFAALDPPPPHMQALLQALRDNPDEISQFMGTMTGAVSIPEFYREENVRRILGAAQQGICASAA